MKAADFKKFTYTPNDFYDYMKQIEDSMSGDLKIVVAPDKTGSSAAEIAVAVAGAAQKFVRTVTVKLVNAAGEVLEWFNGSLHITTADVTAGDGVSAVAEDATIITFVNGMGSVDIEYTGSWAAADTNTVTVGKDAQNNVDTILGYTLMPKTSVDTIVA